MIVTADTLLASGTRSFLPGSACRHADRTISSPFRLSEISAWRMVSEDSELISVQPFLLIDRTRHIFTDLILRSSSAGFSVFPAYSQV
jgi:hypothetical protein